MSAAEPDLKKQKRLNNSKLRKYNFTAPAAENAVSDWGEFVSHPVGNPSALKSQGLNRSRETHGYLTMLVLLSAPMTTPPSNSTATRVVPVETWDLA